MSRLFAKIKGCVVVLFTIIILLTIECKSMESHNHEPYILDTRNPLLISDKASGEFETHFGMSVALASGPTEDTPDGPMGWVFIGAPTSNSTDPTYRKINNPGVLWRCSLGNTTKSDTCEILNIDPSIGKKFASPAAEDEGNSYIGGTVEVKDGRLVSCGPRWTRGQKLFMNGMCYWLSENVTSSSTSYHHKEFSITKNPTAFHHRLMPLFTSVIANNPIDQYFTSQDGEKAQEWALGQAGFSSHMIKNMTGGVELLLGAPGIRLWSGAVVRYIDNPSASSGSNYRLNRDKKDTAYSEFVVGYRGTKTFDKNNHTSNHWFDYFGYAVSSGNYFNSSSLLYAGGAPRGNNLNGEVVIFDIPNTRNSKGMDSNKENIKPVLQVRPPDGAFGSYFGSVISTFDIDGDGQDELLVGAPLYTVERKQSSGSDQPFSTLRDDKGQNQPKQKWFGDHGSVFVYTFHWNNNNSRPEVKSIQILNGSAKPASRFGSAISYLRMSTSYIVVGAPYEEGGRGAIYIYKAEAKLDHYVQRVLASSISKSLYGFGCSISLPMDIDQNETPDLAIGAYKSKQVVILRTRPNVALHANVTFVLGEGEFSNKVTRGAKEIKFKVCLTVNQLTGIVQSELVLWTRLTLDTRLSNGSFSNNKRKYTRVSEHVIVYETRASKVDWNCEQFIAKIIRPDKLIDADSDIEPITLLVDVWYNESSGAGNHLLQYDAISGKKRSVNKNPSDGDFTEFKSLTPYSLSAVHSTFEVEVSPNDCQKSVCKPNLIITTEWFHPDDSNRTSPKIDYNLIGSFRHLVLRVNVSNDGETAIKPRFNIGWKRNDITASEVEKNLWLLGSSCKRGTLGDVNYNCIFTENVIKNRVVSRELFFDMGNIFATQPTDIFNVTISAYPLNQKTDHTIVKVASLELKADSSVILVGSKETDYLRNPFDYNCTEIQFDKYVGGRTKNMGGPQVLKLYSAWRQTYKARIEGSNVATIGFTFKLPWGRRSMENEKPNPIVLVTPSLKFNTNNIQCKIEGGMGHFYLVQSSMPGTSIPHMDISPEISGASAQRRRRQTIAQDIGPSTSHITPKAKFPIDDGKTIYIHCNDEASEFECIKVHCTADNVRSQTPVEISFEFYLVKDAIDELMVDGKEKIVVESIGSAIIFENHQIQNMMNYYYSNDDAQTQFYQAHGSVASWVYFVSILCGILLLSLIVFFLYKCGFFHREEKVKLETMKAELAEARKSMMPTHVAFEDVDMDAGQSQDELVNLNDEIGNKVKGSESSSVCEKL